MVMWRGGWRQLVDAKEGVALAGDVLHEGDAQFVERDGVQVVVVVADVGGIFRPTATGSPSGFASCASLVPLRFAVSFSL